MNHPEIVKKSENFFKNEDISSMTCTYNKFNEEVCTVFSIYRKLFKTSNQTEIMELKEELTNYGIEKRGGFD